MVQGSQKHIDSPWAQPQHREVEVSEIAFDLPDSAFTRAADAANYFYKVVRNTSTATISCDLVGSNLSKSCGLGPDAAIQMAFQAAAQIAYGRLLPTYESNSTRKFLHGRTETVSYMTVFSWCYRPCDPRTCCYYSRFAPLLT